MFLLIELWALLDRLAVAPAWAVCALLLASVGFRTDLPGLRFQAHVVAGLAFARLFYANLDAGGYFHGLSYRLLSMTAIVASHYYEWWRQGRWKERLREWERWLSHPYLYTAAGLLAGLLYLELRPSLIEAGWAAMTLVLVMVGSRWNLPDLRYQGYILAAITFWRALATEFVWPEIFASTEERIAIGAVVVACLFLAQLCCNPPARLFVSLLATTLATAILFQEVSGSMLTVAWGIEGAALLATGFPLRDRTLRLSGLALFLICIGKLFLYDLRELETLPRILSFFVLGVILVSVSWIYTRFRDRIQRYL